MKVRDITAAWDIRKIRINETSKGLFLHILTFVCGFLVSGASVFGAYSPFGIALTAAVPGRLVFTSFAGAFVGYIAMSSSGSYFRYIAAMAAVIAIRWTLSDLKGLSSRSFFPSAVSFFPTLATGLAMISVSGFSGRLLTLCVIEAMLAAAAAFFFSRTAVILSGTKSLGMLVPQETACLILSGCIGILSLAGLKIGFLSAGRMLCTVIILFSARYGGITGGAAAGIATGSVLGMYSSEYSFLGAAYSLGGLTAGLFSPVGKLSCTAAFVLSSSVIALQSAEPETAVSVIMEAVIGSLIFLPLPKTAGSFFRTVFISDNQDEHSEGLRRSIIMRLDFASKVLSNVSDEVEEVSEKLSEIITPTIDGVYRHAVDSTCSRCGMRVFCWEHKDGVSFSSFSEVTDKLTREGEISPGDLSEDFRKKCCRTSEIAQAVNRSYKDYVASRAAEKRIDEVRQVVAGQFCGLGDILGEMAEEYSNYEYFDNELSDRITVRLKELGLKPASVSCRTDYLGRMSVEAECDDSDRKELRRALLVHEIGKICGRRFDTPHISGAYGMSRITMCEKTIFDVETAASQHISGNGRLCGDHFRYFTDGSGKMIAVISDGMGSGGRAAVDGGMASSLMEKLVRAGLGFDCSLKVVNSALLVKSGDESLATIDIVSVDLFTGHTDFMKAGAALSFIRKENVMYRVETPSLPAGILPQIDFTYTEDELSEGDIIVMLSDGATATGDEWIERMILSWDTSRSMQLLADTIVDEAVSRRTDGHDDDITVIAMQIGREG